MIPRLVHQPAYLSSSSITPAGSVHKSRDDSVVRMWVQLKRWCVCGCCRRGIVVMDVIWYEIILFCPGKNFM